MNAIVGFTVSVGLCPENVQAATQAESRVLDGFAHLGRLSISIGTSQVSFWGHGNLSEWVHILPDGAILALAGSPFGTYTWAQVQDRLAAVRLPDEFELPWDGRVVLLWISADGEEWRMWNDWVGSIPVFYAQIGKGRIASTIEPVVVAGANFSADDIYRPALVSLLVNGHYLSDWTLFEGMKVVPADSFVEWNGQGFHWKRLWTVEPSDKRWETGWDDLVDEMHELSYQAIARVLKTQHTWILPLSSGLDSRLIAVVGADLGVNLNAYAWGERNTTDVVYSQQIARAVNIPWKWIDLGSDYLLKYTRQWADWFGSSIHFHGMYQMSFLDAIQHEPIAPVVSGYLGDSLSNSSRMSFSRTARHQIYDEWLEHWPVSAVAALLKNPIDADIEEIAGLLKREFTWLRGTQHSRESFFELWSRQRLFTNFQATLCDYWRGVVTPFLDRDYARFCMSLPRAARDNRRLLVDVYHRYYGRVSTIPGSYSSDPFIVTGRYLMKRRLVKLLPALADLGVLRGFKEKPLRMDMDCVQVTGRAALWPIDEARPQLGDWLDMSQVDQAYRAVMASTDDIRPLRKLQSVQALAYRLLEKRSANEEIVDGARDTVFECIQTLSSRADAH